MNTEYATLPNKSVLNAQDEKLKTAEEVLDALRKEALEKDCKLKASALDAAQQIVQGRRGVR